jgi:hypothetical protein
MATSKRLPTNDPRTVARDIPGIFDALFPQLIPGVVTNFNRRFRAIAGCAPVDEQLILASTLNRAMLFEFGVAACEQLLRGQEAIDWNEALIVAVARQRRHFDASSPTSLSSSDMVVAEHVARNLTIALNRVRFDNNNDPLFPSPAIPGFQWIASGVGDFAVGTKLIEVKCTRKHFSASDYRQIVMYWLLGYASSVESNTPEWSEAILINPRLNRVVQLSFNEIINVIGAGRSKVDLLQLFSSMVGDHVREHA